MMPVRLFTTNTNQSETTQKMRWRSSLVAALNRAKPRAGRRQQQHEASEEEQTAACPEIQELIVWVLPDVVADVVRDEPHRSAEPDAGQRGLTDLCPDG